MQWHQLDHMRTILNKLQTDNHINTSSLNFYQAGCSSWRPTNSVRALKATPVMTWSDAHHLLTVECWLLNKLTNTVERWLLTFRKLIPFLQISCIKIRSNGTEVTERYLKLNSIHSYTLSSLLCSVECWYVTDYWVISYLIVINVNCS